MGSKASAVGAEESRPLGSILSMRRVFRMFKISHFVDQTKILYRVLFLLELRVESDLHACCTFCL